QRGRRQRGRGGGSGRVLIGANVIAGALRPGVADDVRRHRAQCHALVDGRRAGLQGEVQGGGGRVDEQRVDGAAGVVVGEGAAAVVGRVGPAAGVDDVIADCRVRRAARVADADGRVRRVQGLVNGVVVEIRVARAVIHGDAGWVIPYEVVVGEVAIA